MLAQPFCVGILHGVVSSGIIVIVILLLLMTNHYTI